MGDIELVLLIGSAWAALLFLAVSLAAMASRADVRLPDTAGQPVRAAAVPPKFTQRAPDGALLGRVASDRPLVEA